MQMMKKNITTDCEPQVESRLTAFFKVVRSSRRSLLLLDYDGTLAAFRVNRFQARPWAGVSALLAAIQQSGRTRLAVITGRPPEEIQPMMALDEPLEVWGLHGAERLYPDGRRELDLAEGEARQKLDAVRAQLRQNALGGLYEDKANAAVMHWRGFSAERAKGIRLRVMELFEPLAALPGLRLLNFDGGLELRAGRDKGGAVQAILAEEPAAIPVAYLGDDTSDEAAFKAVNCAAGAHCSALVRRSKRATQAELWLRPAEDVRRFLRAWKAAVQ